jgi:hypothetical protein
MFNPSNWQTGTQFRVTSFGLEIGTENLLPIEDMVTLRAGWLQPQREFIDQSLSKLFLNNAVNSAKGVDGNIPFSSSFSTWSGTLKFNLHETVYLKNGLFMSYPEDWLVETRLQICVRRLFLWNAGKSDPQLEQQLCRWPLWLLFPGRTNALP